MKKVTFLSGDLPPKTGGEVYNFKIYSYLEQSGIEVEYINLHKIRYLFKLACVPVVGILAINLSLAILAVGRGERLLVFDQYFGGYTVLLNAIHRCWHQGKSLAIVHHIDHYESEAPPSLGKYYRMLVEQLKLMWATRIVTNSQYCRKEIESLGYPATHIDILPPGFEPKAILSSDNEPHQLSPDELLEQPAILFVGHCIPRKGTLELLKAFAAIDRRDYVLHVVGKTDKDKLYFRQLKAFVKQAGLTEAVIFHGRTDDATLDLLYRQADMFVLPSQKEGFGIVLLEAMYYGLPIIATDITAIPELVSDGQTGLLIPPRNPQVLAEALTNLIERPDLRDRLGQAGRKRLQAYDWNRTGARFLAIIRSLSPELNVRASA